MRLFIDPGANDFGAAVFTETGGVYRATLVRNEVGPEASALARGAGALNGVLNWLRKVEVPLPSIISTLVEMPFVYPGKKTKNPNSVMLTAAIAGAFAAFGLDNRKVTSVLPRDWKGGMDGEVFIRKVVQPSCEDGERLKIEHWTAAFPASYRHNIWDAVGLGLWQFKRLKSGRVFHGAVDG